jgi:uncharacterized protein YbaR (Trm112 family)
LEILACPIDHAFPLELTVLKWEDETVGNDKVAELIESYRKGNVLPPKMESPVISEMREDAFVVRDNLIIKAKKFSEYIQELIEKIEELTFVHDKSKWQGEKALELIRNEIKNILLQSIKNVKPLENSLENAETLQNELKSILVHLEFLNLLKYHLEIEDAVIKCPNCKRWYPVFETIPQMLPDDVRNVDQDNAFKEKWKAVVAFN